MDGGGIQILVFILFAAIAGVVAYFGWLQEKKRREAMAAFASRMGLRFSPGKDSSHDERYAHFEVFRKGHSRVAFNTMVGDVGLLGGRVPVVAGDFRYKITSGSGKSRSTRTYKFSYAIVHLPFDAPDLLIRREGMFDKIAGVFGQNDIDFELESFSRKFHVASPNKKFAYDVLDQRMIEWLMGHEPPTVDIEHGRCLITDGKSRWSPEEFESCFGWLDAFFDRWPDHVVRRLAGGNAEDAAAFGRG